MTTPATPLLSIGPSLFALITAGMYDNPLSIYREYIQNAVDSLASHSKNYPGKIKVTLEPQLRQIRIRDNGPGLSYDECLRQLIPIGRSNKCIGADRGFRGIGRLSALAFASSVTFRTRSDTRDPVTVVTWRNPDSPNHASHSYSTDEILQKCVTVTNEPAKCRTGHFFEVEIVGISRHASGPLLNEDIVRSYIAETCPVPMSSSFPFAPNVACLVASTPSFATQKIIINDNPDPILRQYGTTVPLSSSRADGFTHIEHLHISSIDNRAHAAVGWIAHTNYLGAIPKNARIRGIRARAGNIQIGDESIFDHLFHEDRFNRWSVGEIHIIDPRILPNARRDYFEPSPHLRNLENQLAPIFRGLSARCRASSSIRNKAKKILDALASLEDTYQLAASGYLSDSDSRRLVKTALERELTVRELVQSVEALHPNLTRLDNVKYALTNFTTDTGSRPYAEMTQSEAETHQKIFRKLIEVSPSLSSAVQVIQDIVPINQPHAVQPAQLSGSSLPPNAVP